MLDPMVKLGAVGNGSTAAGHVEFDKFMVLISAENSADFERREAVPIRGRRHSEDVYLVPLGSERGASYL